MLKNPPMQPVILIARAGCDYFQGSIIENLSKDTEEGVKECIRYANLAMDLLPSGENGLGIGLGYSFAQANGLSRYQTKVVIAALQRDYPTVIRYCEELLKSGF